MLSSKLVKADSQYDAVYVAGCTCSRDVCMTECIIVTVATSRLDGQANPEEGQRRQAGPTATAAR